MRRGQVVPVFGERVKKKGKNQKPPKTLPCILTGSVPLVGDTMGKKGKKARAGKPKKLTPKDVGKRFDALVKKLEEELKDVDLFAPLPPTEDCAICLVPLSHVRYESCYMACCGNSVCWACHLENQESIDKQNEEKSAGKKVAFTCPFCREPKPAAAFLV